MKQINPEYHNKFSDFYGRKNAAEMLLLQPNMSEEQLNATQAEVDGYQKLIDDFDTKVKVWEGLKIKDKIDHQTGWVKEV